MYVRLAYYVTTYPRRTILFVLLLAVILLVGLRNTHFVSDFDSSLPNRSPLTKQIRDNQERFGSRNTIMFLVSGSTQINRVQAACAVSAGLQSLPEVAAAIGHLTPSAELRELLRVLLTDEDNEVREWAEFSEEFHSEKT